MANNVDGSTWVTTDPADGDMAGYGPVEIKSIRAGVKTRIDKEHVALATSNAGGEHVPGSAKAYYEAVANVTKRPDRVNASPGTDLAAGDAGRMLVRSGDKVPFVWTGSAWSPVAPRIVIANWAGNGTASRGIAIFGTDIRIKYITIYDYTASGSWTVLELASGAGDFAFITGGGADITDISLNGTVGTLIVVNTGHLNININGHGYIAYAVGEAVA